jgi:hypothetical protein
VRAQVQTQVQTQCKRKCKRKCKRVVIGSSASQLAGSGRHSTQALLQTQRAISFSYAVTTVSQSA